ncbi:allergen Tha p 1 [Plodia interpunctella]|uniref:allergen Tha p 1 n=1 Tax=Plodia interpunctella TaxID=58824 RepID=UPI002368DA6A|nr:allergen Tha p 1-like [Plodia interpunctella]XP_053615084.1 allergen Tha p 1-like [Plodia interpunctella]
MKVCVALCVLALTAVALGRPQSQYTDRYDNIDLNEILNNRRLLVPYIQCVLGEGKCTPDGKELKSHIREALENDCAKCTENQREGSRRVIAHLIKHEQDYWAKLKAKYDPSGKYSKRHEQELAAATA